MKIKFTSCKMGLSLLVLLVLGATQQGIAQKKHRRALFIGNSFVSTNFLPLLCKDLAFSVGDTLDVDWNAPGAFTFQMHASDGATLGKMSVGNWNYVVLQEQSQLPALSDADVAADVFPYAHILDSIVHNKNACGRSVFFQTWGYKNGDVVDCPAYPPVCTYEGMDSLLFRRYRQMSADNEAIMSPVGLVFRLIRTGMPSINLYTPDDMHPSEAGSYAAAVTFYTIFFRKDPALLTYNYTLPASDAAYIKSIVSSNIYSKLSSYFVDAYDPQAAFTSSVAGNTATFSSAASLYASNYKWDFGDGGTSTLPNPSHTYATYGTYNVRLIVDDCVMKDTVMQPVNIISTGGVRENTLLNAVKLFPNPVGNVLHIETPLTNVSVNITEVIGKTAVAEMMLSSRSLPVSGLAPGIYFLNITDKSSGAKATHKFIKE